MSQAHFTDKAMDEAQTGLPEVIELVNGRARAHTAGSRDGISNHQTRRIDFLYGLSPFPKGQYARRGLNQLHRDFLFFFPEPDTVVFPTLT